MRITKKNFRNGLVLVIVASVAIHVVVLVVFGAITIARQMVREEKVIMAAPPEPIEEVPEFEVNLEQRNQESSPPRPNPIVVDSEPDIDLPALDIDVNVANTSSYGRGGGGVGDGMGSGQLREMAMDLTDFGYSGFVEGTLEGRLFDTKLDRNGKPLVDLSKIDTGRVNGHMQRHMTKPIREFTDGSWSVKELERKFFAAETKLYASYFFLPNSPASEAPKAFGAEKEITPVSIIAYYEGVFTPRESGKFRFLGIADDVLVVRANNQIVLDGSLSNNRSEFDIEKNGTGPKLMGLKKNLRVGDWMKWTEGQPMDLQVFLAEVPGGWFYFCLFVQKEGEEDVRVFSTKELTSAEKRRLREMHPDIAKRL